MNKESVLLAKAAALMKAFNGIQYGRDRCFGNVVEPLFPIYDYIIKELKDLNPDVYIDVPVAQIPTPIGTSSSGENLFSKGRIEPFVQSLDYLLELSSNVRVGERKGKNEIAKRIFISHGSSQEWMKVQIYIEKDLEIETLELAQQPNLGRTVIQKLIEESTKCSVAVIVMTGDDMSNTGEIRTRENVMHEIGYFQGLYGIQRVVLLHEHDVSIPSNILGLVYIPFPKKAIETSLGALARELKVLI